MNRLSHYLILISFFAIVSFNANAQQTKIKNDLKRLESQIDSLFLGYNSATPGAAISIIYKGEIQYKKAYGSANLEYDIANTTSTIFHVASLSKQFTALSVLLLQEQGKLSLDDDVRKYIQEVPDFGHAITLRHLATHTSGLRDQWHMFLLQGVRPDDGITNEHVLELVKEQKALNFNPGDEYLYCNTGYSLLAEVVARVSGQTFAEFTRENIFSPLQMNSSSFNDDYEKIIKNRAQSYYARDNDKRYSKKVLSSGNVGPTNLLTTVEDFAIWIMNFESSEPKVGSPKLFKQMTTEAILNNGKTFGGGLGLFMNNTRGFIEIEHGGADAGFRAQVSMFPSIQFAVAVVSNNAECDARMIASNIADLYLSDLHTKVNAAPVDKKINYIKLKPKMMEPFVGHYWNKEHAYTRRIYLKNDTLMHFRTENNESPLAPIGKSDFKVMAVPVDVLVRFENKGGTITMTETVNGGEPRLLEKFNPVNYSIADWLEHEGHYYSNELKTTYQIEWHENKLIAQHMRMGRIELKMIKPNFFTGSKGFFGSVEFLRDKADNITGFKVSNGRARNLLFEKQTAIK